MNDASTPLIFGPAYLDRVVRVDRPASRSRPSEAAPSTAASTAGGSSPGDGLTLVDPAGNRLDRPGTPRRLAGPDRRRSACPVRFRDLLATAPVGAEPVRSVAWHDDLGGMGAGFASALGGDLDLRPRPRVRPDQPGHHRPAGEGSASGHHPIRVDHPADWTLLVTSGEHGDKLPIGFRGCHAALPGLGEWSGRPAALRIITASLPNRLAERGPPRGRARSGPSRRPSGTCSTATRPSRAFADAIDLLSCNRGEWEALADREQVAWQVSILAITDGPAGATLRFTTPEGEAGRLAIPAFPRTHPPSRHQPRGRGLRRDPAVDPPRSPAGPPGPPTPTSPGSPASGPPPPPRWSSTASTSASPPPARSTRPSAPAGWVDRACTGHRLR